MRRLRSLGDARSLRVAISASLESLGEGGGGLSGMEELGPLRCDGCRACCKRERVILSPEHGDDIPDYDCIPTRQGEGPVRWMLRHKPNGDCIYLAEGGCMIWGRHPWACRAFDCRKWLLGFSHAERRLLMRDIDGEVAEAAGKRLAVAISASLEGDLSVMGGGYRVAGGKEA